MTLAGQRLVQLLAVSALLVGVARATEPPVPPPSGTTPSVATPPEGQQLYQQRCAACHESGQSGIPPRAQLQARGSDFIVDKLLLGSMQAQTLGLSEEQISAIAHYLALQPPVQSPVPAPAPPAAQ